MKDLITEIVQAIVDRPAEVAVNEIGGDHTVVLELRVAKSDRNRSITCYLFPLPQFFYLISNFYSFGNQSFSQSNGGINGTNQFE